MMPWVGLHCVIVVLPKHTPLIFVPMTILFTFFGRLDALVPKELIQSFAVYQYRTITCDKL